MPGAAFNAITVVLLSGALLALAAALGFLIALIVQWRSPNRRRHLLGLLLALAAAPLLLVAQRAVLLFIFLPAQGRAQQEQFAAARAKRLAATSRVQVGDPVPSLSLTTSDGERLTLPAPGKVVLINFFATWCGPCEQELPQLERLWQELRSDDRFRLIVIGREESEESVRAYRRQQALSLPMAADPDRALFNLFATDSIPRTIVVSPDGRIVFSQLGFDEKDLAVLKNVVREQLRSKE